MRKQHLFLFAAASLFNLYFTSRWNSAGPHREESDMWRVCQRHQRVRRLWQISIAFRLSTV
jgi:ABC-type tungstate transport system permease subunit